MIKEIAGQLVVLAPFVWEKIAAFTAVNQNAQGLVAALRFELSANLDLLAVVKPAALKEATISDPAFRALVESLRTEAAASVLFSPNRTNYKMFRGLLEKYAAEADSFETEGAGSVFTALSYAVRKIETLKTLTRLAEMPDAPFINVNLPLRLERIHQNLLALDRALRKIEEDA